MPKAMPIDPQIEQFWKEYIAEIQPAWGKYLKAGQANQQADQEWHRGGTFYPLGVPYKTFLVDIQPAIERLKQKVADYKALDQFAALAISKGWAVEKQKKGGVKCLS